MIEHMRQDRQVVERLFDGAATLTETFGSRITAGIVEVRIGGRPVGQGRTLREALSRTSMYQRTPRSGPSAVT